MNFFLEKLGRSIFLSQSLPTLGILHAKFGLIWTTSWSNKKDLFLIYLFREIQKVPYELLTFFLGKLYQKYSLFYVLTTLVILLAEFGLIWSTPWPDEKDLFLKFLFREIQKVRYEILTFFLGNLYQKVCFVSRFNYTGDTPCRVWFDLDNSLTRWKRPIFKIPFWRNSKSSVWNTNFFPG